VSRHEETTVAAGAEVELMPRQRNKPARDESPPPAPPPLRVPVADAHTHLDLQDGTVPAALEAAAAVGVTTLVQVGVDVPSSRWSAEVAERHPRIWATVALHPNEAPGLAEAGQLEAALDEIDQLAALPQVRGIGETGLDYFRTPEQGQAAQSESFRQHIEIAKRHAKPLVIHDRDAHADVLRLLAEQGAPEQVVFHCYSGDVEMARLCAKHGYVLSFSGTVTFANAAGLREAVAAVPEDLLLVETDAPFLTPMPYRGRPNAPYLIPLTVRAMAAARGQDEDALATALAANAERVFGPF
jgi:TatD DNase family protein